MTTPALTPLITPSEALVGRAWEVRVENFGDSTDMCSLVNAKSGGCAEEKILEGAELDNGRNPRPDNRSGHLEGEGPAIKLRATWNLPAGTSPDPIEADYRDSHLPAVRALPGLRRHNLLSFIRDPKGGPPAWWRGEELYFEDVATLDSAAATEDWKHAWSGPFGSGIAGPRFHAFVVDEEFRPTPAVSSADSSGEITALSGIWQVPAEKLPEQVDPVYLDVHVPGVRALPRLRCHTVMRAVEWPAGEIPRAWRSAEIRFASQADFDAAFAAPQYEGIRTDGFNASVAGPDVDVYTVVEEWTAN
jgi:uncharacterized protein (TIGR02118 family)